MQNVVEVDGGFLISPQFATHIAGRLAHPVGGRAVVKGKPVRVLREGVEVWHTLDRQTFRAKCRREKQIAAGRCAW